MTNIDATPPVVSETRAPNSATALSEDDDASGATSMSKRKKQVAAVLILLVILGLLFAWYLLNRKPLSELPGLSTAKVPHYEFSIYGATQPLGVVSTPSGDRIYVTESGGTRMVRVYDKAGKATGTLTPPKSAGAAHIPVYVAINPTTNDVYVSDRLTNSVYIYDEQGKYLRTFAPKGDLGAGWSPLGLAFAKDGTLYVTDVKGSKTHRVLVFGPDGALVRSMGAPGQLSYPNGIAVEADGNIDVSDSNNGRLVTFSPDGKMLATVSRGVGEGDLGLPRGAAVDDAKRLYVVDTADHMVRIYSVGSSEVATPAYIASFGGEGQLDGTFEYPNGVATDTRAHVYVTDRENNRVQVWSY